MVKGKDIAIIIGVGGLAVGGYMLLAGKKPEDVIGGIGGFPAIDFSGLFAGLQLPSLQLPSFDLAGFQLPDVTTIFGDLGKGIGEKLSGVTEGLAGLPETISAYTTTATSTLAKGFGESLANIVVGWTKPYVETVARIGKETGISMAEKGIHPINLLRKIQPLFDLWKYPFGLGLFMGATPKIIGEAYRGLQTQQIGKVKSAVGTVASVVEKTSPISIAGNIVSGVVEAVKSFGSDSGKIVSLPLGVPSSFASRLSPSQFETVSKFMTTPISIGLPSVFSPSRYYRGY